MISAAGGAAVDGSNNHHLQQASRVSAASGGAGDGSNTTISNKHQRVLLQPIRFTRPGYVVKAFGVFRGSRS